MDVADEKQPGMPNDAIGGLPVRSERKISTFSESYQTLLSRCQRAVNLTHITRRRIFVCAHDCLYKDTYINTHACIKSYIDKGIIQKLVHAIWHYLDPKYTNDYKDMFTYEEE